MSAHKPTLSIPTARRTPRRPNVNGEFAHGTPDEHLARVLARRRAVMLGSYWSALGREDLEDALAQATL